MKSLIKPGIYRHYKGKDYQVIGSARHSENDTRLVLYYPLYGDESAREYWVRPLAMFTEDVMVNGQKVPRFALLEEDVLRDR